MFELRDYQEIAVAKGVAILNDPDMHNFVYLSMEVRTGKTLTALSICNEIGAENVVMLTKAKAKADILNDYNMLNPNFTLVVESHQGIHKIPGLKWGKKFNRKKDKWEINKTKILGSEINYNVVIFDEAHRLGAFPKPSLWHKQVKQILHHFNCAKAIFLSGTPCPESYSQLYHQVSVLARHPWDKYENFYKWAGDKVRVTQKYLGSHSVNDYSDCDKKVLDDLDDYMVTMTQKTAGFVNKITEHFLHVDMKPFTYKLIKRLRDDRVVEGRTDDILADTPAKLQSKVHQLCGGTIKFEPRYCPEKDGMVQNSMVLDYSKVIFIRDYFKDKKIAIFYKFKEEYNALKATLGDALTDDIDEFNTTDKWIALQILSGREGISLRNADCIVFYAIDFASVSYWQGRDRMTTKTRTHSDVYWVFSRGIIEASVYKAVSEKKDYTLNIFKRDVCIIE